MRSYVSVSVGLGHAVSGKSAIEMLLHGQVQRRFPRSTTVSSRTVIATAEDMKHEAARSRQRLLARRLTEFP